MKENENNIIDEKLIRYLAGIAGDQEHKEVEDWINLNNDNALYFNKFKSVWESSSNLKAYQLIDTESSLKNVKKRIDFDKDRKSKVRPLWIAIRIAAILVLFFGIYLIFRQNDNVKQELKLTKIETGNEIKTVVLPDSTVISLNRNSHIEYSEDFNQSERRIIFDGEAYFEVKPDKKRPFIIETGLSETRVLGTAFNLKAIKGLKSESIVVTHGLVEFAKKAERETQKVLLEKGEKGILSDLLKKEKNNDPNFMAWKTGIFIFNDEPLPQALELLSEYYQVEIRIQGNSLQSYTVSGKYEKKSIDEVIEILEMTLQVKSEKKNGQYWLKP